MKKTAFLIGLMFALMAGVQGQNLEDALRYSNFTGASTARSLALGGAFSSLGGDFYSLSSNPAGLGVYRKSEFTFTPLVAYSVSNTGFNSGNYSDFDYDLGISNLGLIGSFRTGKESGWLYANFGFGYNQTNRFNQVAFMKTSSANSSLLDDWVNDANQDVWSYIGNDLASRSDLIFLNDNSDWSNDFIGTNYGQVQRRSIEESGHTGEYLFSAGANYNNQLYLGATFGITAVHFKQSLNHYESDLNDQIDIFNSFTYQSDLKTSGSGFDFKFGAIFTPINWVRFSASVHSPVFYSLHDSYSASLTANLDLDNESPVYSSGDYDYDLITPPKLVTGASFILGKIALVSVDYEMLDYSLARLRNGGDGYTFDFENEQIQAVYQLSHNIKLGTEFRLGGVSLRAGYANYGSPYQSDEINSDAGSEVYSGGIGINNNDFYIDFGYAYSTTTQSYFLYQFPQTSANIESIHHRLLMTLGFRF